MVEVMEIQGHMVLDKFHQTPTIMLEVEVLPLPELTVSQFHLDPTLVRQPTPDLMATLADPLTVNRK
jgi:hypothetical protein